MIITASTSYDTLIVRFEIPEEIELDIESIFKEVKSEYKHVYFNPYYMLDGLKLKFDTPMQLAKFVSWLSNFIAQNW